MNPTEKTNQDVQFSFRLERELSDMIVARAQDEGVKTSVWVRKALAFALENMIEEKETVNKSALVEMLEHDTNFQDLLFEKMAQKLRLNDLKNYLADFALYYRYSSAEEFCSYMQKLSARFFNLLPESINDDGIVSFKKIECTLQWKDEFTWKEFLQLTPAERKAYDFFYLEIGESAESGRTGLYFWTVDEDITDIYPAESFDNLGAYISVYGVGLVTNERKPPFDIRKRIVKMVRYAVRDANIGDYIGLRDNTLTGYYITNSGYFPADLPLGFGFFWVSEKWKNGEYNDYAELLSAVKDGADETLRPVVAPRWHYTDSELKRFKDGDALPPYARYEASDLIAKWDYDTRLWLKTGRPVKMHFVRGEEDTDTDMDEKTE